MFNFTPFLFLLPFHSHFWKGRQMMFLKVTEIMLIQQAAHQVSQWELEILGKE